MKCQKCGADTLVRDTRKHKGVFLRRRRECFNGHTLVTFEVYTSNLNLDTLDKTVRGVEAAATARERKRYVSRHPNLTTPEIMRALGIGAPHARRLRRGARGLGPNGPSILNETKIP